VKVVIVAAGRGSRLATMSDSKPLVQLSGKPLLEHIVETVVAASGAEKKPEIIIVTGWNSHQTESLARQLNRQLPAHITTMYNEDWQKGNGTSVLAARAAIDEPFVLLMADHIVDVKILRDLMDSKLGDAGLLLAVDFKLTNPMVDLDDVTRVQCEGEYITAIGKHLEPYNGFDTGCFLCSPTFFVALTKAQERSGDFGISGGVRMLAGMKQARAVDIGPAEWVDVDTPEMLEMARGLLQTRFT